MTQVREKIKAASSKEKGLSLFEQDSRPRRNRRSKAIRGLCSETQLSAGDLIYPLFVHEGASDEEIAAMPGCFRFSKSGILREIESAHQEGIGSVVLFPAIDDSRKSSDAKEAFNQSGLIPNVVSEIKKNFPEVVVITDIALDPYSSDGHDGLVSAQGDILNDQTIEVLIEQALCHANAGADIVAPSDMMDGRIGAIRGALDSEGHSDIGIMSYTAKYASAFYGPFRGALDSAPRGGDKKTYQMDPRNIREAIRELELDEIEGADIVMVKPAGPYLDVICEMRANTCLPIAAYQVSGEYLMIKSAAASGWLDEQKAVIESLTGIRRAGADMILSYFARSAAKFISDGFA